MDLQSGFSRRDFVTMGGIGSGPKTEEEGDFDKNASLGIAWRNDLLKWEWPGKR